MFIGISNAVRLDFPLSDGRKAQSTHREDISSSLHAFTKDLHHPGTRRIKVQKRRDDASNDDIQLPARVFDRGIGHNKETLLR